MHTVSWSVLGQQSLAPHSTGRRSRRFSLNSFRDDLRQPLEAFRPAVVAQPVACMDAILGFAVETAITFVIGAPFFRLT
jgi:hypothetical protein